MNPLYDDEFHGEILISYMHHGDDTLYGIAASGWAIKKTEEMDVAMVFYSIMPAHIDPLIKAIRSNEIVVSDHYDDAARTRSLQPIRTAAGRVGTRASGARNVTTNNGRKEGNMAKKKTTIEPAPFKELRMGAKATKLLNDLDLSKTAREDAIKKATAIARKQELPGGRDERILRDYYLYQALGKEMPMPIQKQWEHFQKTGKEMAAGNPTAGTGRRQASPKAPGDGERTETEQETVAKADQ